MLGTSSSIANVGDRRKEGGILPYVIYVHPSTLLYTCSCKYSSGQNFGGLTRDSIYYLWLDLCHEI